MTPGESVKLLREIDAYARAGAGVPIRVWLSAGEVADAVEQMAAEIARLREERRWIPVGERLPENAQRVWAFVPGWYGSQEAQWVDGHWRDHFGSVGRPVTHWQPLPPGPEGGEVE